MNFVIEQTWNGQLLPAEHSIHIELVVALAGDLRIVIKAPFYDDPPPLTEPGSTWALWEHEVVEIFLVGRSGHYLELEFGPHGHFLALHLSAPRVIEERHLDIEYGATIQGTTWRGEALIPQRLLPRDLTTWNAFAISGTGANRRYMAWSALPGGSPDFHQPHQFPCAAWKAG